MNSHKHILFLLFCLLVSVSTLGQKQFNSWYTGTAAQNPFTPEIFLDFSDNGLDTSFIDYDYDKGPGVLHSVPSMCSTDGSFLFAGGNNGTTNTFGSLLVDRNQVFVQNGFLQELLSDPIMMNDQIIRYPGEDSTFILFSYSDTVVHGQPFNSLDRHMYYVVIGYNAQQQLEVIQGMTPYFHTQASPYTIIRHANKHDFWVVCFDYQTGGARSFLLDSTGLSTNPVISGQVLPPNRLYHHDMYCEVVPSSNDKLVAFTSEQYTNTSAGCEPLLLAQFDNASGIMSNPIEVNVGVAGIRQCIEGASFSANSKYLYVSTNEGTWPGWQIEPKEIYQLDLSTYNAASIEASATRIDSMSAYTMQMGPDRKIYFYSFDSVNFNFPLAYGSYMLCRIENPDEPASNVQVSSYLFNLSLIGATPDNFPTHPSYLFYPPKITYTDTCHGDTVSFALDDTTYIDSIYWDFGTGDTSYGMSPTYHYTNPGTYPVMCIYHKNIITDTIYDTLSVYPIPTANLGPDTSMCEGDTFSYPINYGLIDILWSNGSTDSVLAATTAGTVWVTAQNACGYATDTVVIDTVFNALVDFGPDTLLCPGDSLLLDATIDQGSYLWSDGSLDSTLLVTTTGNYHVAATNLCGTDYDTIAVTYTTPPQEYLQDTIACVGDSVTLQAVSPYASYLWQLGTLQDSSSTITLYQTTTATLTSQNTCGITTDTAVVEFITAPTTDLGPDTVICQGDTLYLSAPAAYASYQWNTLTPQTVYPASMSGTYALTVTNQCGTDQDQLTVFVDEVPSPDLGPDTAICQGDIVLFDVTDSLSSYQWDNGPTGAVNFINQTGSRWVTVTNSCGTGSDTIEVRVDSPLNINLGVDTILCSSDSITLQQGYAGSYLWSTGDTSMTLTVTTPDTISLEVTNGCGTYHDSIAIYPEFVPSTYLGSDVYKCVGDTLDLDATFSRASYLWSTGATSSQITVNNTNDYWVIVTNVCGGDDDTVEVWFDTLPLLDLGPDRITCQGDTVVFTASAPRTVFQWSTSDTGSSIQVTDEGRYWVEMQHACDTLRDYVSVTHKPAPEVTLSSDTVICEGESVLIGPTLQGAVSQQGWVDGQSGRNREVTTSGTLGYYAANQCGTDTAWTAVEVQANPAITLPNDTVICDEQGFWLTPTSTLPLTRYLWSTGEQTESIYVQYPASYQLEGATEEGCTSTAQMEVSKCTYHIHIPNTFTPNGDGLNEVFIPVNVPLNHLEYRLSIYNRWGEEVFSTQDPTVGWSGKDHQQGSYSYRMYLRTKAQHINRTGNVVLVR